MTWLLLICGVIALAYQAIALVASIVHWEKARLRYSKPLSNFTPPVSMLKPVRGLDDNFAEAIRSHADQDYPEYEILFGVHTADDPAVPVIKSLIAAKPRIPMRLIVADGDAPNGKAGLLVALAKEAKHPVWLVNDADISVPGDYLRRVVVPLELPEIGLVTCLYRATARSLAGMWEAFGIATDFIPSTLVAPLVGVKEFGLGSTLCFRAEDWIAAGGFETVADYIADDYQLTKRITSSGKRATMSEVVVETTLSDPDWKSVWEHQVRWARTIRVSRGDGYAGLPVTHAGLWSVLNLAAGDFSMALTLWLARVLMGVMASYGVLRFWPALLAAPLIPLWDLWAFAVWISGFMGRTVWWRGQRITLEKDGRIRPNPA